MTVPHPSVALALPGASEISVILGIPRRKRSRHDDEDGEPYVSEIELWSRLVGLLPRFDTGKPSADAEIGRWSEIAVLDRLAHEQEWSWGQDIVRGPTLQQPGFSAPSLPWAARPDALAPVVPATVEAKSPRQLHPDDWSEYDAPPYYIAQVLGQIAVAHAIDGVEVGVLAAMARAPGWHAPRVWATYQIHRDAARERRMVDVVSRWVDAHVLTRSPPMPDGSESAGRTLQRIFTPVDEQVHEATPTDLERFYRYLCCRDVIDELQAKADELQQLVRQSMGEATALETPDGVELATWKASKDGVRVFKPDRNTKSAALQGRTP